MSGEPGGYAIDVYMVGGSKLTLPIRDAAQAVSTMRAFQKIMGDSRGTPRRQPDYLDLRGQHQAVEWAPSDVRRGRPLVSSSFDTPLTSRACV